MNNRSMRLDTECDVTIDAALPANAGREDAIRAIRDDLIAEHLDLPVERVAAVRSEEHTSELQSLMRLSYAVFCLKKKNTHDSNTNHKDLIHKRLHPQNSTYP